MRKKIATLMATCMVILSLNDSYAVVAAKSGGMLGSIPNATGTLTQDLTSETTAQYDELLNKEVTLLVELTSDPMLDYYNQDTDSQSLQSDNDESNSYSSYERSFQGVMIQNSIEKEQQELIEQIEEEVNGGEEIEVISQYQTIANAIVINAKVKDIDTIQTMENVKAVNISVTYERPDGVVIDETKIGTGSSIIGADNLEYKGEGMVIAVLDTGIDTKHEAFNNDVSNPQYTKDKIAEIVANNELRSETNQTNPCTNVNSVYHNSKIPYAYDYCDQDCIVDPTIQSVANGNDHGNHVAGIAAAKSEEMIGIAPEAQLVIMKVFPDEEGGAPDYVVLDALEDCVTLGVDVINMSLGRECGYTTDATDIREDVFKRIQGLGISLVVSAGNDGNSAEYNYYDGYALTTNPDIGTVGSPSTNTAALSVASVENTVHYQSLVYLGDGTAISYVDRATDESQKFSSLQKKEISTYEYIEVGGLGEANQYEAIDVTGKIAVVKRGSISFQEKLDNAAAAGAIGIIVVNTSDDTTFGMAIENYTIPAVLVTKTGGEKLVNSTVKTLTLGEGFLENPTAGEMSSFSSWGCTPDLKLKPEITGVGGFVYSTLPFDTYGNMQGTSMSSPQIAGLSAVVKQYVSTIGKFSGSANEKVVNQLLMSTANQISTQGYTLDGKAVEVPYSPRRQGAGLANAIAATTTNVMLYNENNENNRPVINFGDDVEERGKYTQTFHIQNVSSQEVTYNLSATVMTETPTVDANGDTLILGTPTVLNATTTLSIPEHYTSSVSGTSISITPSEKSVVITGQVKTVSGTGLSITEPEETVTVSGSSITVAPNEDVEVTVTIQLTEEDMEFLHTYFENGEFVEGFLQFEAVTAGEVDLSIPFLGFYGDWTKAPILEATYYEDYRSADYIWPSNVYSGNLSSMSDYFKSLSLLRGTIEIGGKQYYAILGSNLYSGNSVLFDTSKIAFSPNGDGYYDSFYWVYSALRGPKSTSYSITDESGNVLYSFGETGDRKSIFNYTSAGFDRYYGFLDWEGTDALGNPLDNNTKVYFNFSAVLDYDGYSQNNKKDTVRLPVVIDIEAPVIEAMSANIEDKTLTVTVSDNQYISGVMLYDENGDLVDYQLLAEDAPNTKTEIVFSIDPEVEEYQLELCDYAYNLDYRAIKLSELLTPTPTGEATPTPTGEATPTPTGEATPTPTEEVTPTPTEEATPTPTVEVTPTPTQAVIPSNPVPTVTLSPTPEATPEPTEAVKETDESYIITYQTSNANNIYASKLNLKKRLINQQNVTFQFEKDGKLEYAWQFDASDYNTGIALKRVQLGLTTQSSGEYGYDHGMAIQFNQQGTLPMEVKVKVNVKDYFAANEKVYLYSYDAKTGKLICVPNSSYQIDEDGYVTLNIIQGGDYVLLSKAAASADKTSIFGQVKATDKIQCKAGTKKKILITLPDTLKKVASLDEFNGDSSNAVYGAVITYKSSDTSILTVSKSGTITAKKKGAATIKITVTLSNGKTKSYTTIVTVK